MKAHTCVGEDCDLSKFRVGKTWTTPRTFTEDVHRKRIDLTGGPRAGEITAAERLAII